MTHDRELFKELKPTRVVNVWIGHGDNIPVQGMGTIAVETQARTKKITDVLYVPALDQNFLSVGLLLGKTFKLYFLYKYCFIKDASGQGMLKVKMEGKSFSLDPFEKEQMWYSTKVNATELWHKRLGHYNYQRLVKMQKLKMVESLPDLEANSAEWHACQFAKQHRMPFPNQPGEPQKSYN